MTIMIIGAPQEAHAAHIYRAIESRGKKPFYFDTRRFPGEVQLNLQPSVLAEGQKSRPANGRFVDLANQLDIPFEEIEAVYWRYHFGVNVPDTITNDHQRLMAHREIESTLGSFFRMLDCRWLNPAEAVAMHAFKPYQTQLMAQLGIRVPETLISNDPSAVKDFFERLDGKVIYKPVRGGAHTSRLKTEDLTPERLIELAEAPVQFQEMIEGIDIRVYLMGDDAFAAEIRSGTLDFRDNPKAEIVPIPLPTDIQSQCQQAARRLLLTYSGIDIRRTPEGEYVFLECNPCPMFIHFERKTGYPITERLTDQLIL
jgi:glutathione synthase/RimK-type ligase-like ATP-grasp enzyme